MSDAELFVQKYGPAAGERGPELFVREVFGAEPDDWQLEVLRAYGRGERRISLRSCHGVGKTAVAAWLAWVQLLTWFPQHGVATAPTKSQLEDALMKEIAVWHARLPAALQQCFEIKTMRVEFVGSPKESFFSARTSRAEAPEALQGIHCEGGRVLLIADEASGVAEQVFEAAVGSMSGANCTTLLMGNPVRTSGLFFDTHHKLLDMWHTFWVGYYPDEETRPPGVYHSKRVVDDYAVDCARRYGDDSNAYRVRVLGEFPKSDLDTVIPYELVSLAQQREIEVSPYWPIIWGADVARQGDDLNALVRRQGRVVHDDIESWRSNDLMVTAGRIKKKWDDTPPSERPVEIIIDEIGLGAGVVDRLRELGLPVRGLNVSESASASELYRNTRAELWFRAREWLAAKNCKLPTPTRDQNCLAEALGNELVVPRFTFQSSGRILVEAKLDTKKRGYPSPNHADAFLLTLAGEHVTLAKGSREDAQAVTGSMHGELKRNIKGIV